MCFYLSIPTLFYMNFCHPLTSKLSLSQLANPFKRHFVQIWNRLIFLHHSHLTACPNSHHLLATLKKTEWIGNKWLSNIAEASFYCARGPQKIAWYSKMHSGVHFPINYLSARISYTYNSLTKWHISILFPHSVIISSAPLLQATLPRDTSSSWVIKFLITLALVGVFSTNGMESQCCKNKHEPILDFW